MKVLIVDDNPVTLALAQARLRDENLDVLCANGGVEGLAKAQKEHPDLVLLDLKMPDMSGYDVCEKLKSDPAMDSIPIIFLTAADSIEDKVKGLDMGAVDYVAKPFDPVELCARVRAALRVKRLQDLLSLRAQLDPLTELWNRQAMETRLRQEWARMSRHEEVMAFVMIDIDHFKMINDHFGHPAGDRVLCATTRLLSAQCRESDMACRYGGEEFAVILPNTRSNDAVIFAERCRQDIENMTLPAHDRVIKVTASFGVADSEGIHVREDLVHRTDEALYQAKHDGRNRVVVWNYTNAQYHGTHETQS
jgi:diguanylate cyclase (GGDEF)-like protein